jgi:hypothetical protein
MIKRKCYYVQPDQVIDPDKGIKISLLIEDEAGHYPLPSFFNLKTIKEAEKEIERLNGITFGLSPEDCKNILLTTLGADNEDDNPV